MAALALLGSGSERLFGVSTHTEEATFSQARFEALKGTWLEVEADGMRTGIQLVDVHPCVATPGLEQYSLVMRGDATAQIKEGIHQVIPGDGAPFAMHLRPSGCRNGGNDFTASFAHRKPTTVG